MRKPSTQPGKGKTPREHDLAGGKRATRKSRQPATRADASPFKQLITQLPLPIAISNTREEFEYFNDRFIATYGYTLDDTPDLHTWWLRAYPDETYRREVQATWRQAVEKAEREHTDIEPHEFRVTCKDGAVRIATVFGTWIGDKRLAIMEDITARKHTEEALQHSEANYRALFETANDAIIILKGLKIIDCNSKTMQLLRYTKDEILGRTPIDFSPKQQPDGRSSEEAGLEKLQRVLGGEAQIFEWVHQRGDGSTFYAEVSLNRRDSAGEDIIQAILRDITERKRAEAALIESSSLLQLVLDTIPVRVFWKGTDERFLGCNSLFAHDAGMASAAEIIGKSDYDMPWREQAARYQQDDNQVMMTGEAKLDYEEPQTNPAGEHIWLRTSKIPLHGVNRCIIGVLGVYEDITERKQAEEAIKRDRAFLLMAIEAVPIAILFISSAKELVLANKAAYEFFRDPEWRHWSEVQWLTADHLPVPQEEWPISRALDHQEKLVDVEGFVRFRSGDEVPVLHQVAPVIIDSELVAAIAVFQDITRLKEADKAKNQFLKVLGHEIKTPLTNIIGWAQLAQGAPELVEQALATILCNANAQKTMLERLLILSRILTGKLELRRKPADLRQLAEEAVACFQPAAQEHHITLALALPDASLPVAVDRRLLLQALAELLDNAVQFTAAGGSITVAGGQTDAHVVLTVQDSGQGIAPEQLPSLLQPFQQIQREETRGGLGIGLALVSGIMEAHGGRVVITSPGVGQGTTVTIELSLAEQ